MQRLDRAGIEVLLETQQFKSWFNELSGLYHRLEILEVAIERAGEARSEAVFRYDYWREIAEEALLRSADLRNMCQNLRSEIASLENQAFEQLAGFEVARQSATGLWERITAIEHRCDDHPAEASRVRAKARFREELKRLRTEYAAANEQKEVLWHAEETLWMKVAERTLMVPELEVRANRLESRYGVLMQRVEELESRAASLNEELADERDDLSEVQRQIARLRAAARTSFSCLCHEDFLYWPSGDDSRLVLVVALSNNRKDYNIEVRCGQIYQCDTEKGVRYLEPLSVGSGETERDERLIRFFEEVA
jgi:chromosome segregation ATPase